MQASVGGAASRPSVGVSHAPMKRARSPPPSPGSQSSQGPIESCPAPSIMEQSALQNMFKAQVHNIVTTSTGAERVAGDVQVEGGVADGAPHKSQDDHDEWELSRSSGDEHGWSPRSATSQDEMPHTSGSKAELAPDSVAPGPCLRSPLKRLARRPDDPPLLHSGAEWWEQYAWDQTAHWRDDLPDEPSEPMLHESVCSGTLCELFGVKATSMLQSTGGIFCLRQWVGSLWFP